VGELQDFVVVGVETRQFLEAVTSGQAGRQAVKSYDVATSAGRGFWDG